MRRSAPKESPVPGSNLSDAISVLSLLYLLPHPSFVVRSFWMCVNAVLEIVTLAGIMSVYVTFLPDLEGWKVKVHIERESGVGSTDPLLGADSLGGGAGDVLIQ